MSEKDFADEKVPEQQSAGVNPTKDTSEVVIRSMLEPDIPWAVALEAQLFADAWTVTMVLEEVINPTRRYLLAEIDGMPMGYAGLWIQPDNAEIMTIGVDPRAQGRGVGQALLEGLITEARKVSAGALLLDVRSDNLTAQRLYERNGFAEIGIRRKYYSPDGCDAIVMRLILDDNFDGTLTP